MSMWPIAVAIFGRAFTRITQDYVLFAMVVKTFDPRQTSALTFVEPAWTLACLAASYSAPRCAERSPERNTLAYSPTGHPAVLSTLVYLNSIR